MARKKTPANDSTPLPDGGPTPPSAGSVQDRLIALMAECASDPLKFVQVAFPWGTGSLHDQDGPDEWQIGILRDIRDGLSPDKALQLATASGHGIGKAQPKSLVVDTPTGPAKWGDLQPGDTLFGKDGVPTTILARHEQGIRPIYRVTLSDGSETYADADHLWAVRGRQHRRKGLVGWATMTTKEILGAGVLRANGIAVAAQWELPQQSPVQYPAVAQPIAPYTLGAWLGDGTKAAGRVTNADQEVWDAIAETDSLGEGGLCRTVMGLQTRLRDLGLLGVATDEVRVPSRYLRTCAEDRLAILQALLDTDGWVEGNGQASFCSTSLGLVEDVVWLARSLGLQARLRAPKRPFYYTEDGSRVQGKPAFTCGITWDGSTPLFRIRRKQAKLTKAEARYHKRWITDITYSHDEDAMCVTVAAEDSLYLTNDFIVTHNSALVAWLTLWSISTKPCTRGVVTANTENQLKTKTWAELAKWYNLCIVKSWFILSATALYSADPAYERLWRVDQTTWSAANTEAFAGLHNQGGRILLIFDEASAIDDVIWEVSEGALTDANTEILWLAFGNPTKNTGRFRECFGRFRHRWTTRQIDSRTSRFSNKRQIQAWAEDYGEDSDFFKVRVRGLFPTSSANQFIPSQDVEACLDYTALDYERLPLILSVDVARYGDDRTVIGYRQGRYHAVLGKWSGIDTVQTTERVISLIDSLDPDAVVVDGDGIGGAVVDQLKHRGYDKRNRKRLVYEFHGGATPEQPQIYYNRRAEVWGMLRDAIRDGCQLPRDHEVVTDLTQVEYEVENRRGRVMLEKKEDMKARGLASPDIGDMLAMTYAVRIRGFREVRKADEEEFPGMMPRHAVSWMGA